MAILRPTWQDIITEHSVQTWQDWPWETWLGPYAVISPRRYRVRVRVWRAGEWVDITSRVASGVIRESNDQPVATLDLRLLEGGRIASGPITVPSLTTMRAEHEVPAQVPALPMRNAGPLPSIAPRRKDSPLNRVNGQYVPLLWIGRLIAVEAAFSEDGSEPDEWWPVFLGELEDEIDTEAGPDGTYVRVFCRDLAARLQRAYIAGPWMFENMYASQMIQAILDRAHSEGLIQEPVQLRLIGPDDFWVERYGIEYTDLWSALQRFCQQRGTDLRYRLNEATGQIELTYWLPDRTMVPGWFIDASQIHREELRISGTDIINRVTVRYRDAQTGQRAEVTVQDADSIAMYGLRHGLIEEPDTDLIPDEETAQILAQTIVEDLKDVPALTRITCPFDPRIQLFDKLRVANPSVRDEAEDYAIEGRELQFSATDWRMTLVAGGRVVVKREQWLERLAKEGVKRPLAPQEIKHWREIKDVPYEVSHFDGMVSRFDTIGVFLRDIEAEHFYPARIAFGVVSSGEYIPLGWDRAPKVVAAPVSALTYVAANSGVNQRIDTVVNDLSPEGFRVHLRTVAVGATSVITVNQRLNHPDDQWISGNSAPGVQEIQVRLRLHKNADLGARSAATVCQTYRIEYRLAGSPDWTLFGNFQDCQFLMNQNYLIRQVIKHQRDRTHVLALPPGEYQIRVTFTGRSGDNEGGIFYGFDAFMDVLEWTYKTDELLADGDVLWFAIEGGAEGGDEE